LSSLRPIANGSEHAFFRDLGNDGIDIRAVSRIGLAFLNEAGVVRLYDAPRSVAPQLNTPGGGD
jgi:hypothetical protein